MREIKYRGVDLVTGEMVHGDLNDWSRSPKIATKDGDIFDVEPSTIGQFTGLTDKNGTQIYEGDVVQCGTLETNPAGQIVWINALAQYEVCSMETRLEYVTTLHTKRFEVIGNIYESPDLLTREGET